MDQPHGLAEKSGIGSAPAVLGGLRPLDTAQKHAPMSAEILIQTLNLTRHPEGGYFRETYRDKDRVAGRAASTAIYFLLPRGDRSKLHRLRSDEVWHFYGGGPLVVVEISPTGQIIETLLGSDLLAGQTPQHVVPKGHWFGAYPATGTAFSFVGCTVAPGFEFSDFELADRDALTQLYPMADGLIRMMT